ncbi:uncharacterized protein [Palaemon carinicauda]|uniref:uncharacterized protein n=1 Tax=Palaemon carinicauda TaxID=392227 RepID=UPI0035B580AE
MDEPLEIVDEYIRLGHPVSVSPGNKIEIKRRISMGWTPFGKQNEIMKIKKPLSLKRKAFNQMALQTLNLCLRNLEPYFKVLKHKLVTTQRVIEGIMVKITLGDKKINMDMRAN